MGVFARAMKQIFEELDVDSSEDITEEEIYSRIHDHRLSAYFESFGLDTSDVHVMFKLLQQNSNGAVQLEDFVTGCFKLRGTAKAMQVRNVSNDLNDAMHKIQEQLSCILSLQQEEMKR